MSRPRLHDILSTLFELKTPELLKQCLFHEDFQDFMTNHGIKVPLEKFSSVFTHTSFTHEFGVSNQEQLEFLGDAVLQLILTDELYRLYPLEKEGKLSKLRSSLVNEKALALLARELGLQHLLLVGKGEFKKGLTEQDVVLADTFEALLGQLYRYQGLEFTRDLCIKWYKAHLERGFSLDFLEDYDAKSKLQELSLAKYKKLPRYSAEAVGDKFQVSVWVNEAMCATGLFSSKKAGEKELANEVIKKGI